MKITKIVLACLAVLAFFALSTRCAQAGEVDCSSGCGFGAVAATQTTYYDSSGTITPIALGAAYTMTETVYHVGAVYAYAFDLSTTTSGTFIPNRDVAFTGFPTGADEYNSAFNYGVITDMTSSGVSGVSFAFGTGPGSALDVSYTLALGDSFTFYAEGGQPVAGSWSATDGGNTEKTLVLSPFNKVPEPNVLTLLGSLALVLLVGIPVGARLRTRTA